MGATPSAVQAPQTGVRVNEESAPIAIYRHVDSKTDLKTVFDPNIKTLFDNFASACKSYPNRTCMAWRPIDETGKAGPYVGSKYSDIETKVKRLGSYFVNNMKLEVGSRIGIWSDNRPEWDLAEQASNCYNLVSVPLYSTLGPNACEYVLKHAEIKVAVVATKHFDQLVTVVPKTDVKTVIAMELTVTDDQKEAFSKVGATLLGMKEVMEAGAENIAPYRPPKSDDLASLIYTSGTTGDPKGVIHTHGTIIAAMAGLLDVTGLGFTESDRYLSYLPAAHIYARLVHAIMFKVGAAIYYWQGDVKKLLTDDCPACRPTFFAGVPRVYGKIYSNITDKVQNGPAFKAKMFNWAFEYQKVCAPSGTKSMWDSIVLKKIRGLVGLDQARFLISGSAPLDPVVQDWLQVIFGPCLQGYGLTETGAALTAQHRIPTCVSGDVGPPLTCCEIKLESVPELNYLVSDKPDPRGEICTRGPNVFKGYYKNPEKTAEVLESDGWFHTGDIGRWNTKAGTLSIIDRKKNIFKLSQGEYVAPDYIQNIYSRNPFVAMIFVHGDSLKNSLVGIVVPDPVVLERYATEHGFENPKDIAALCKNEKIIGTVFASLKQFGEEAKLRGFEKIRALHLVPDVWTVPLLTPTFKLCRNKLEVEYKAEITQMYESIEKGTVIGADAKAPVVIPSDSTESAPESTEDPASTE